MAKGNKRTISGPGAADYIETPGGLDTPESGSKGTGSTRDEPLFSPADLVPEVADNDDEEKRRPTL